MINYVIDTSGDMSTIFFMSAIRLLVK